MKLGTLVLAAGLSQRIEPIAQGLPKPLISFGGRSLIEWNLTWLEAHGLMDVWINLHHRAEMIRSAIGSGQRYGLSVRYSYEETILGTAGAWRALRDEWTGTSLVVYGDNVMRFDLSRFLVSHQERGALASVALFDPAVHANTGIAGGHARLTDGARIERFVEGAVPRAGEPEFVNAGAYLLEPEVAEWVGTGFQDFGRDVLPEMATTDRLYGYVMEEDGFCLGLDTPECFMAGERMLAAGEVVLR